MLNEVKSYVNSFIDGTKNEITIESENIYGDSKLEYTLSIESQMASLSILADFTYDFFVTDIESENIIMSKTLSFDTIKDLLKQVKEDLEMFSALAY